MKFFKETMNAIYRTIKNKKLVFHIYDHGLTIAYYKKNNFIDSYYCKTEDIKSDASLHKYLTQRKDANAKFIVNSKNVSVEKLSIPALNSFTSVNPIEHYCLTRLNQGELYTYKVHTINKDGSEVWKGVVYSMPSHENTNECFSLLYQHQMSFFGVYFHSAVADQIAREIAGDNKLDLENYIYSLTTILDEKEINIQFFHGSNILESTILEYPSTESDQYVLGVIEQNLSDIWIKLTSYRESNNLSKVNIFIVNNNLRNMLTKSQNNSDLYIFPKALQDELPLHIYMKYFLATKQLCATSPEITKYKRYRQFNSILFPPLYISLSAIVIYVLYINLLAYNHNKVTSNLYKDYTKIMDNIRVSGKDFPEISNIIQLADLYNTEKKISVKTPYPFNFLEEFYNKLNKHFKIQRIFWQNRSYIKMANLLEVDVHLNKKNAEDQISRMEEFIEDFKKANNNIAIHLSRIGIDTGNLESSDALGLRILVTIEE